MGAGYFYVGPERMSANRPLLWLVLCAFAVLSLLTGCDSHDSEYFPYGLKGLNVLVYNNETDKEYFGGFVEASYFSRKDALSKCAARAYAIARQYHLERWGYVCCTVTASSNCATKVR